MDKAVNRETLTLDARPDRLDLRDREYRPPLKDLPESYPPSELAFSLFKHYAESCELVLYQGNKGACTGFGLAAVINYLRWKESIVGAEALTSFDPEHDQPTTCIKTVSERMLYHNARIYDEWDGEDYEGSSCRGAMKGWHRHGVCDSNLWPYRDSRHRIRFVEPNPSWSVNALETPLGSYYRINPRSIVDMQSAIYEVGAIYCSSDTHSGWFDLQYPAMATKRDYAEVPFIPESIRSDSAGGHAFAIVGYTRDGFIVQNSWGPQWGLSGFAILGYADWVNRAMDAWVVVRGAPTSRTHSPCTVVHQALQDKSARSSDREGLIIQSISDDFDFTNQNIKPWSEEDAYKHSVVIGKNGRAVQKLIDAATPEDCIKKICTDFPFKWLKDTKNKKLVIHVHGCLCDEKVAIRRAQILGPYYIENGIYPIFIVWQSDLAKTLAALIESCWKSIVTDPLSGVLMKNISAMDNEKIDRALEVAIKQQGGKSLWSEMKQNAMHCCDAKIPAASGSGAKVKGAMVNVTDSIAQLGKIQLHVTGHSSGAILIGQWLDVLARRKMELKSISLYAPACTVKFVNDHYKKAVEKNVFAKSAVFIDLLSDERERADVIGSYNKSLLYLVSRAFEDMHKEPLLGMEATWTRDSEGRVYKDKMKTEPTDEEVARFQSIDELLRFWKSSVKKQIHDKQRRTVSSSTNSDVLALSHQSFVNDIEVVEATIQRILGRRKLKYKVESLGSF